MDGLHSKQTAKSLEKWVAIVKSIVSDSSKRHIANARLKGYPSLMAPSFPVLVYIPIGAQT